MTESETLISTPDLSLGNVFNYVSLTLVVYDAILTFPRKYECIWRRRKGMLVTAIYLSQRYCEFIPQMIGFATPHNTWEYVACGAVYIAAEAAYTCELFGVACFSVLRTWAVWNRKASIAILLFFPVVVAPATNLTISRGIAIGADALVLVLTLMKTFGTWKASRDHWIFTPRLTNLFVENGAKYFITLFVLHLIVLLLDQLDPDAFIMGSTFVYVSDTVTANLVSRFILDLRDVDPPQDTNEDLSSLRVSFNRMADEMGAPAEDQDTSLASFGDGLDGPDIDAYAGQNEGNSRAVKDSPHTPV
ncbi:hypothetical protein EIP91_003655 [Steccherinum ochraceum]|uniref:DUF6533 domain-containing protein n=1 Tax=Steccherinum ochraceum TaxID=92696 RepID=A0A4R0RQS1_9APHY|nr:hypothetical protein EIP91_003655 [Steccherinum ochraceum]